MPTVETLEDNDMQPMQINDPAQTRKAALALAKKGSRQLARSFKNKAKDHPVVVTLAILMAAGAGIGFPLISYIGCYHDNIFFHSRDTIPDSQDKNLFDFSCDASGVYLFLSVSLSLLTVMGLSALFYYMIRGIQILNEKTGLIHCCESENAEPDGATYSRLEAL